jgi:hypothetical protein
MVAFCTAMMHDYWLLLCFTKQIEKTDVCSCRGVCLPCCVLVLCACGCAKGCDGTINIAGEAFNPCCCTRWQQGLVRISMSAGLACWLCFASTYLTTSGVTVNISAYPSRIAQCRLVASNAPAVLSVARAPRASPTDLRCMQYHQHSCLWTLHMGARQQRTKAVVHHHLLHLIMQPRKGSAIHVLYTPYHSLLYCTVVLCRKCLDIRALCVFILLAAISVMYLLVQLLTAAHMYAYVIAHAPAKGPARGLCCTLVASFLCRCLCRWIC